MDSKQQKAGIAEPFLFAVHFKLLQAAHSIPGSALALYYKRNQKMSENLEKRHTRTFVN